eukprot:6383314-Prymnesium_polylepis.2
MHASSLCLISSTLAGLQAWSVDSRVRRDQSSGSSNSTRHLAPGEEKPYCPPPVINSKYPDGVPNLSPTLARELHNTKLIAFRVTAAAQKIKEFGAWFDDGCAGWATTRELAISLYDLLELHYPGVKWSIDKGNGDKYVCGWTEQLGFKVDHDRKTNKTKLTAPKHSEALKQFVTKDLHVTPRLPCSETIKNLKPKKMLEPQEPGHEQQQQGIKFMYECIGHITTLPR